MTTHSAVAQAADARADLRSAVVRWCDNSASLARSLGRGLRRGRDISDMRVTALAQARANLCLMEAFMELLEADRK